MTQSAKHFTQIADDVGRRHLLVDELDHGDDDDQ